MTFADIRLPAGLRSTFAAQVQRDLGLVRGPLRSICQIIQDLATQNNFSHGGIHIAQTSAAAPEWNSWAQMNACVLPYPSRPVQAHGDVALIDAAVKRALVPAAQPNAPRQGQLPQPRQPQQPQQPQQPYAQQGPQIPTPTDETAFDFDWVEWGKTAWNVMKGFFSAIGFGGPEAWTQGVMTETDRLKAAQMTNAAIAHIAPLNPGALSGLRRAAGSNPGRVPEWAYQLAGSTQWRLALNNVPDPPIPQLAITTTAAVPPLGTSNGRPPPETGSTAGVTELLGPGEEPQLVTVRRCRGGKRLAINGRCYPKELLTGTKLRMNNPKKAIVPHSAGARIRKAKTDINRIQTYASKDLYGGGEHSHRHSHARRRRTSHHHSR